MLTITNEELETINVSDLKSALPGASFHGEEWVKCPYCGYGKEIVTNYFNHPRKDGYIIFKCEKCNTLFKFN